MIYFTVSKGLIDSISYDKDALVRKFPNTLVYATEQLKNIYYED